MQDPLKARPVSGEIMTAASALPRVAASRPAAGEVVDAEFETLAPPPAPRPAVAAPSPSPGMETLRLGRPGSPKRRRKPGGTAFWTAGMALALAAFWVSGGHALVPRGALERFLRHSSQLRVASLRTHVETFGDRSVLFIDGEARNDGSRLADVPPLGIRIEDDKGRVARYFLGTSARSVGPGESFAFSSRLAVPKDGVKSVSVSFDKED
jgi:hypothetical protein